MSAYGVVYLIRNLDNGKVYVGQTTQPIAARWKQHCSDAASRRAYPLHLAIRKYGRERFEVIIMAECSDQEELNRREVEMIAEHRAGKRGAGYNVRSGGDGGGKLSPETRAKLSARLTGRIAHNKGKKMPEHQHAALLERYRLHHPCLGRVISEEMKAKIGAANAIHMLGRKKSEATKAKHREAMLRRFSTPEARQRQAEALAGRICAKDTREKIRAKMIGRTISPEWREKLRLANLGKKQSPELIAKRMLAMKIAREQRSIVCQS